MFFFFNNKCFVEHVEEVNCIVQFCTRPCNAQKGKNRHSQKCAR